MSGIHTGYVLKNCLFLAKQWNLILFCAHSPKEHSWRTMIMASGYKLMNLDLKVIYRFSRDRRNLHHTSNILSLYIYWTKTTTTELFKNEGGYIHHDENFALLLYFQYLHSCLSLLAVAAQWSGRDSAQARHGRRGLLRRRTYVQEAESADAITKWDEPSDLLHERHEHRDRESERGCTRGQGKTKGALGGRSSRCITFLLFPLFFVWYLP